MLLFVAFAWINVNKVFGAFSFTLLLRRFFGIFYVSTALHFVKSFDEFNSEIMLKLWVIMFLDSRVVLPLVLTLIWFYGIQWPPGPSPPQPITKSVTSTSLKVSSATVSPGASSALDVLFLMMLMGWVLLPVLLNSLLWLRDTVTWLACRTFDAVVFGLVRGWRLYRTKYNRLLAANERTPRACSTKFRSREWSVWLLYFKHFLLFLSESSFPVDIFKFFLLKFKLYFIVNFHCEALLFTSE